MREYFILDVRHGHTNFYQLGSGNRYRPIQPQDGIIYSTVLPGFQFRLEHLLSKPDLMDLIDDPVYQTYVLLDYQKQMQLTELARQEAQAARQEVLAAQQENERLMAKLRELGIDPKRL